MRKQTVKSIPANNTNDGRWDGALEGLYDGLLVGWALDRDDPARRVVVEICLDGEPIASGNADVARSDLVADFAPKSPQHRLPNDNCHGFVIGIGGFDTARQGVLTARVANTEFVLGSAIQLTKPTMPSARAVSMVVNHGGLRLHGWAVDPQSPSTIQSVYAYLGDTQLATSLADGATPLTRTQGNEGRGFTLDLPLGLADGRTYEVRVVNQSGLELNGSPLTVCCYLHGAKSLIADPSTKTSEAAKLLLDTYERFLPRDVGIGHYKHWAELFEDSPQSASPGDTKARNKTHSPKLGVIGCGLPDAMRIKATVDSIKAQSVGPVAIYGASSKGAQKSTFEERLHTALADGCELITCVRWGDTLSPHAVAQVLPVFLNPLALAAYTDSVSQGVPWFKPAWDPVYALASDYPLEMLVVRKSVVQAALETGAALTNFAQFAWTMLAQLWPDAMRTIWHVPQALYCRNSKIAEVEYKERWDAVREALRTIAPSALLQLAKDVPEDAPFQPRTLHYKLPRAAKAANVTLIIPTRDRVDLLERCIESLQQHTKWPHLEIMVVDNDSIEPKTKAYFKKIAKSGVTVLSIPGVFNFAKLNNRAVEAAKGDIIGLVNNDIEALHPDWLEEMLAHLLQPGVGAVGAKLLWPNRMVQHGGVLLGLGYVAGHFGNQLHEFDWGDHGRNQLAHHVSAVTAACLMVRKCDYLAAGGMDEAAFPVAFNDVDFCLKLRHSGKSIVWTPQAKLIHAESASRGHEDTPSKKSRAQREVNALRKCWGDVLLNDPAYHPSLGLEKFSAPFESLATPPRNRAPRHGGLRGTSAL